MVICKVLDVSPVWLLSGIDNWGNRGNPQKWYAVDAGTDAGKLLTAFNSMNKKMQERLLGYADALSCLMEDDCVSSEPIPSTCGKEKDNVTNVYAVDKKFSKYNFDRQTDA